MVFQLMRGTGIWLNLGRTKDFTHLSVVHAHAPQSDVQRWGCPETAPAFEQVCIPTRVLPGSCGHLSQVRDHHRLAAPAHIHCRPGAVLSCVMCYRVTAPREAAVLPCYRVTALSALCYDRVTVLRTSDTLTLPPAHRSTPHRLPPRSPIPTDGL